MNKKTFVFLLLFGPLFCFGQDPGGLFIRGNESYNRSEFDSAISAYNLIPGSGFISPELYFNLGNAWYKKKKYPQAILWYERSLKLSPGDEDTRVNLALANLFAVDQI